MRELTQDQKDILKDSDDMEQFGRRYGYTEFEVTFDGDFVYISYADQDGEDLGYLDLNTGELEFW